MVILYYNSLELICLLRWICLLILIKFIITIILLSRGLAVLHQKFNPLTPEHVLNLQDKIRNLTVQNMQDFNDYVNEL